MAMALAAKPPRACQSVARHGAAVSVTANVSVTIAVEYATKMGQVVVLVGSDPAMGGWKADNALGLKWNEGNMWKATIDLPVAKHEFKCVCKGSEMIWQPIEGNVVLDLTTLGDLSGKSVEATLKGWKSDKVDMTVTGGSAAESDAMAMVEAAAAAAAAKAEAALKEAKSTSTADDLLAALQNDTIPQEDLMAPAAAVEPAAPAAAPTLEAPAAPAPAMESPFPLKKKASGDDEVPVVKLNLDVTYRSVGDEADFTAAAAVRTATFYPLNPERSSYSQSGHQQNQLNNQIELMQLKNKSPAEVEGYENTKVVSLMATIPTPDDADTMAQLSLVGTPGWELDALCKLEGPSRMTLGTVDINVCERYPSEELQPGYATKGEGTRAFISNLAVNEGARRQGVGAGLLAEAEAWCKSNGVQEIYAHVVPSNEAAAAVFTEVMGYQMESIEKAALAYGLDRERRMLLHKQL